MDSINHTGDNIILSSPIASNISQSQMAFDLKKFTECRPVFFDRPQNNTKLEEIQDDNSSEDITSDVSGNLTDSSGNSIITFKKYTYKEIENEINESLKRKHTRYAHL